MQTKIPSFDEATRQLREFVRTLQLPEEPVLVSPADCRFLHGGLAVRGSAMSDDTGRLEYDKASKTGFGVELHALGALDEVTICVVIVPGDAREADLRMISGLKLSVRERRPKIQTFAGLRWRYATTVGKPLDA